MEELIPALQGGELGLGWGGESPRLSKPDKGPHTSAWSCPGITLKV